MKATAKVKGLLIVLTLLLAFGMAISTSASEELVTKTLTFDDFKVAKSFFAQWETTETGGIKGTNSSRDNEFFSTTFKVSADESFTFEADVSIPSGQEKGPWAGLVLNGQQDQLGGARGWYNLRWYADSGYVRFVNYSNKSAIKNTNFDYVDRSAVGFGQTHHMKIEYEKSTKTFSIFWDGKLASSDKGSGVYADPNFEGEWYIAVISTKADTVFENIKLTAPASVFEAAGETTTDAQTTTATTTAATTTSATTTAAATTAATTTDATTTDATTTTASPSGEKSELNGGVIVGIIIAVLAVGGVVGYLIFRKKKA